MATGILSKYDSNNDDVIDETEMASLEERSKGFVARADSDKNGKVTKAELMKLASNMSKPRGGSGGGGGGGRSRAAPADTTDQTGGGTP